MNQNKVMKNKKLFLIFQLKNGSNALLEAVKGEHVGVVKLLLDVSRKRGPLKNNVANSKVCRFLLNLDGL